MFSSDIFTGFLLFAMKYWRMEAEASEKGGMSQMKEYEMVWEIFNECANNQMRDVFIEEISLDGEEAVDAKVREMCKDEEPEIEKEILSDGSLVYHVNAHGLRQRYTFTEI